MRTATPARATFGADDALTSSEMDTLRRAGYLPMGGGIEGDRVVVKFAYDGAVLSATRAEWRVVIAELSKAPIEDELAFGKDAWVYCRAHLRAHQTGWCTVAVRDKMGLGVSDATAAYEKCREWGFALYADRKEEQPL